MRCKHFWSRMRYIRPSAFNILWVTESSQKKENNWLRRSAWPLESKFFLFIVSQFRNNLVSSIFHLMPFTSSSYYLFFAPRAKFSFRTQNYLMRWLLPSGWRVRITTKLMISGSIHVSIRKCSLLTLHKGD